MNGLFSILSLQSFRVSLARKLWFVFSLAAFGGTLYLDRIGWLQQYLSEPVINLLLVLSGSYAVLGGLRLMIVSAYRRRSKLPLGERDNFVMGMDSAVWLLVFFVTTASIFPIFHLKFVDFVMSLSVFSVAISWLFKEYITNFIDSYRLMFSRDFLIGDYIKLGESSKGIITDISFRATKVKTDSGDVLFIPNSTLMNSEVVNFSKVKLKRIIVPFSVSLNDVRDVAKFESYLRDGLADSFPGLVEPQKVFLRIVALDHTDTDFTLEVSVDTYSFEIEDSITKAVYEAVLKYSLASEG